MDIRTVVNKLEKVSDTPLLDARLLTSYAENSGENIQKLIQRRLKHEPVSKIIGRRGFWRSDFITTEDVLDPRPDSETMIDAVLKTFPNKDSLYQILDIGTGSGCLLFSLLDEYQNASGIGIDISEKALSVAKRNQHGRRAELCHRDFSHIGWYRDLGKFDFIVSNPPYIPSDDIPLLSLEVRKYDPLQALDGGSDGLDAYRVLAKSVHCPLKEKGYMFLEIGIGQSNDVISLFRDKFKHIDTVRDFGGIERILIFQKK